MNRIVNAGEVNRAWSVSAQCPSTGGRLGSAEQVVRGRRNLVA